MVEDMTNKGIHGPSKDPSQSCFIPALQKPTKSKVPRPIQSAVFDIIAEGAQSWQDGKWKDFLKSTTFDPAVGYPITDEGPWEALRDVRLDNGTAFDAVDTNPLEFDSHEDLFGDGGLGGGDEFSTGKIDLQ